MIPRTDQFREINEREVAIDGVASPQDQVWYLLKAILEFLSIVRTLERDAAGNYLARDPRVGILHSVHRAWVRVYTAAQIVVSSSLVPVTLSPEVDGITPGVFTSSPEDRLITDAAGSLVFLLLESETKGVIPAAKVERVGAIAARVGDLAMTDEVARLRVVQAGFQKWVRETRGVRAWLKQSIMPLVMEMVDAQERLVRARREAINLLEPERKRAWDENRSLAIPDEVKAMYDRESDPRHMDARRIGRLRDHGKRDEADLAEAFAVLAFHDAGEAGSIDKLMPILCDVRGLPFKPDLAYFARCDSGLERRDWEPRFSAQVMEGMIARFKARMPVTLEKPDGWTVEEIAKQVRRSEQWVRERRDGAELPKPKHGQHGFKYGPDDIGTLADFLVKLNKPGWSEAAARLRALIGQ